MIEKLRHPLGVTGRRGNDMQGKKLNRAVRDGGINGIP
jgi:hypothetical protein